MFVLCTEEEGGDEEEEENDDDEEEDLALCNRARLIFARFLSATRLRLPSPARDHTVCSECHFCSCVAFQKAPTDRGGSVSDFISRPESCNLLTPLLPLAQ